MTDDDTEESQEMGIAPRLKWAPILAMALLAIELLVLLALVLFLKARPEPAEIDIDLSKPTATFTCLHPVCSIRESGSPTISADRETPPLQMPEWSPTNVRRHPARFDA